MPAKTQSTAEAATKRKILVTSALPYANGPIHIGHLVGYIQADIWVRFKRMQDPERKVYYVCADDTHGTPIMLRAEKDGVTPKELIARMNREHARDFKDFHVEFDNYYSTDSPENQELCEDIYRKLDAADLIARRSVEQFYDPAKQMFLPDRYIKGECPKCGAKDQYGDSCEVCGSTYSPTDLKNPYSVVSGEKPIRKSSEHYFFRLSDRRCIEFLKKWTRSGTLQPEAANKLDEWFAAGLQDWDISRDAPYFGFPIPGTDGKKFFYVWLDAPVGYMASFKNLCAKNGLDFDEFWQKDSDTELYHFIGKDILYFHALFWPAMLEYSGYRTPTKLSVNGFLTVNGEKMSKSRGTFITAESYLTHGLNPEWLRYYYAAKSNGTMEDIDLSFDDFVARVNSDLVGKYVNIASRATGLLHHHFSGKMADLTDPKTATELLHQHFSGKITELKLGYVGSRNRNDQQPYYDIVIEKAKRFAPSIKDCYEKREFGLASRLIMELADDINKWWNDTAPWEFSKRFSTPNHLSDPAYLHRVCSVAIEAFRLLTLFLKPILPALASNAEQFLALKKPLEWSDIDNHLPQNHQINHYQHLITRVDPKQITTLVEANKETLQPSSPPAQIVKDASANRLPLSPRERDGVREDASANQLPLSPRERDGMREDASANQLPLSPRERDGVREDVPTNQPPSLTRPFGPPSPGGRGRVGAAPGRRFLGRDEVRETGPEGSHSHKTPLPKQLLDFARKLREQQTDAEQLLWGLLRDRRLHDAKFKRQYPIEADGKRFILDFYCDELGLAIEADGGQHQQQGGRDETRVQALDKAGISIVRFWNNDILANTETVLESIWNTIEERLLMQQPPSPPTGFAPLASLSPEGEGKITTIAIDDFSKVDLRIAKIVKAEYVEGADKLLRLTVDLGEDKPRNIFAGIRSAYEPKNLEGRLTVVVANLAPRKMKFGVSEGMVLAAGPGGKDLWILSPDEGAQPGMRVK